MMIKNNNLHNLLKKLKEIQIEWKRLINKAETLEIKLNYIIKQEKDLLYNISLLKQEGVVVMASQYKQSVKELELVRKQIRIYSDTLDHYISINEHLDKTYKKFLAVYINELKDKKNNKVIKLFNDK